MKKPKRRGKDSYEGPLETLDLMNETYDVGCGVMEDYYKQLELTKADIIQALKALPSARVDVPALALDGKTYYSICKEDLITVLLEKVRQKKVANGY